MSLQNKRVVNNICLKSCDLHKKIEKKIDKMKEQLIIEVWKNWDCC